jgi:predicted Zn-dependent protease with MMP-like domain
VLRVPPEEFDVLVEKAIADLPEEFARLVQNVVIVVEEEPDPEVLAEMGFEPDEELLGLYQGIPLTERGANHDGLPDQVSLYRQPLLRFCRSRRELIREVRDTLVHELGHYFGLSDEEMPY